jgi:hypothetical protein
MDTYAALPQMTGRSQMPASAERTCFEQSGQRKAGVSWARIRLAIWQGYEDRWDVLGPPPSSGAQ